MIVVWVGPERSLDPEAEVRFDVGFAESLKPHGLVEDLEASGPSLLGPMAASALRRMSSELAPQRRRAACGAGLGAHVELFRDPSTGRIMWVEPADGSRHYVSEARPG